MLRGQGLDQLPLSLVSNGPEGEATAFWVTWSGREEVGEKGEEDGFRVVNNYRYYGPIYLAEPSHSSIHQMYLKMTGVTI